MADNLFPNLHLPKTDFSWLGELPGIVEESSNKKALKASLADLKGDDIGSLRAAATKAFSLGTKDSIDAGMRLMSAAQARESSNIAAQRSAQDAKIQGFILDRAMNPQGGMPSRGGAEPSSATVPSGALPPPAPDPFAGPQGKLPGPGAALQAPVTGSPSEQILAQAEDQQPVPPSLNAPPQRLAGPPPSPDTAPAPAVAQVQPWMKGAAGMPGGAPTPLAPAPPAPPPSAASPQQAAMNEVDAITRQMRNIVNGKGISQPGELAAMNARLRDAIDRAKPTQAQRELIDENIRIAQTGEEPFRNEQDMKNAAEAAKPNFLAARKLADETEVKRIEADRTGNAVKVFQRVLNHPAFEPGNEGVVQIFNDAKKMALNVKDTLVANGFLDPKGDLAQAIDRAGASVPLREAVAALQGQLVTASLGGLGSGRSDKDVVLTMLTQPGLAQSKEGAQILAEYMKHQSDNAKAIGIEINKYMIKSRHRANPDEMHKIARDYTDSHPILQDNDGKPTALGERLNNLMAGAPPPPAGAKPGDTSPPGGPQLTGPLPGSVSAPAQAAPTPRKINRKAAIAAGYTDAEIDAYEKGQ